MAWANSRPRSARNYSGAQHKRDRQAWARRHDPSDPCVRCGHPLGPMGPGLHLDHDDHDPSRINGFAHGSPCPWCRKRCNLAAGARKARALQETTRIHW